MPPKSRTVSPWEWVDRCHACLDQLTYYQLLGVDPQASGMDIRDAYYRVVSSIHPDRFGDGLDAQQREKLVATYTRVVEAYRVLTEEHRRRQYDRGLSQGKIRWTEDADPAVSHISHSSARRFYQLAQAALLAGDAKTAALNLKLALSIEPDNHLLREELAKVSVQLGTHGFSSS